MNGQNQNSHSDLLAEVDEALRKQPKTIRQEMRDLVNAPKGSDAARARRTLGWTLILFGIFGIPALFFVVLISAAVIGALF